MKTSEINPGAESYLSARTQIRKRANECGAALSAIELPFASSDGVPLTVDVVSLGELDCRKVLVTVSGLHGLEGSGGSIAQQACLGLLAQGGLSEDLRVVFIHAANPWGWVNSRRTARENIDLNRNFWRSKPASNRAYFDELYPAFSEGGLSDAFFRELDQRREGFIKRRGMAAYMDVMSGGQFHRPDGIMFGGFGPTWENHILRQVLADAFRGAEKIAFIDWHTGIGAFGEPYYLCFNRVGGPEFERAASWWGADAVAEGASGFDGLPRPYYQGLLFHGALEAAGSAQMVGGVIEFGTYPYDRVSRALVADTWIGGQEGKNAKEVEKWLAYNRESFCPNTSAWSDSVARNAALIFERTIAGLTAW